MKFLTFVVLFFHSFCFYRDHFLHLKFFLAGECDVDDDDRVECVASTRQECEDQGCCYAEPEVEEAEAEDADIVDDVDDDVDDLEELSETDDSPRCYFKKSKLLYEILLNDMPTKICMSVQHVLLC